MNKSFIHILALIGCSLFLVGNIVFDLLDTPESPADYRIFYIPFSFMVFTLILLAKDYAKTESKVLHIIWWFFLWLSIGQIIKFLLFNPFHRMISDYGFLGIAILGTIVKLCQLKPKK